MASAPIVEKIANPQGGMADPKTLKSFSEAVKPSDTTGIPVDPSPESKITDEGLEKQLADLELRDDYRGNGKPINHLKIPAHQHDARKLFVGGLPTTVTEAEFLLFFEQFGEVIDSVVMIDRVTKRSRGFGFVTFANEEVALSLLNSNPGKTGMINIQGKMCEIKASEPKSMSPNAPRYVHGSAAERNPPQQQPHTSAPYPKPTGPVTLPVNKAYPYPTTAHHPADRYYDSRNFDQLYSHHTGYASNSIYGYQYSGYEAQAPPYSPYYGHYRDTAGHYGMSTPGYYNGLSGPYSQYNYAQGAGGYAAYPTGYYNQSDYSGQTSAVPTSVPTSIQRAYGSDGSLESYGEYYEDNNE